MRPYSWLCSVCSTSVSMHAPRAGCDLDWKMLEAQAGVFQSTHPGRSATSPSFQLRLLFLFQSTHPGRGATADETSEAGDDNVSIHAPRAGCDRLTGRILVLSLMFQSTHPGRGATLRKTFNKSAPSVSIHAPRAGCDNLFL